MTSSRFNVLFLCTGNSARSILAEAILNRLGPDHFQAFSAGSHPVGYVHPLALRQLQGANMPTEHLRSKSWNEFARPDAPAMDFVFTVCDKAAGESCPVWPGQPMTAHWGIPDPGLVRGDGDDGHLAFHDSFLRLQTRIGLFLALPLAKLDRMSLQHELNAIGRTPLTPPVNP